MRVDRSDGRKVGGVLVATRKKLAMENVPIDIHKESSLKCLLIKFKIKKNVFYLCTIYIPPTINVDKYEQFFEYILDKDINFNQPTTVYNRRL